MPRSPAAPRAGETKALPGGGAKLPSGPGGGGAPITAASRNAGTFTPRKWEASLIEDLAGGS